MHLYAGRAIIVLSKVCPPRVARCHPAERKGGPMKQLRFVFDTLEEAQDFIHILQTGMTLGYERVLKPKVTGCWVEIELLSEEAPQ